MLNKLNIYKFTFYFCAAMGIIYLSQFANLCVEICASFMGENNEITSIAALTISMFLPFLIGKRFHVNLISVKSIPLLISILSSLYLIFANQLDVKLMVFTYIVAISEETFFRGFIEDFLEKGMSIWAAVLVQSIFFAVLNHSAEPILNNLCYRLPAGIVLSIISKRFGIQSSITIHYVHNLLV